VLSAGALFFSSPHKTRKKFARDFVRVYFFFVFDLYFSRSVHNRYLLVRFVNFFFYFLLLPIEF